MRSVRESLDAFPAAFTILYLGASTVTSQYVWNTPPLVFD